MKHYKKINKFLVSSKHSKLFNGSLISLITASYIFRAHPYILHPQLFAEDGDVWLSTAYNLGLKSVYQAYNQFLQLFDWLFSLFAVHFVPLQLVPLFYVMSALLMFLLLCYYLFSPRSGVLNTNYQRLYVALSLCLLANAGELFFNFSNAVFYLGLVGLFLIIVNKSTKRYVNLIERILFFVLCFTSVFTFIYLIILLIEWLWYRRKRYYFLACTIAGSIAQVIAYTSYPLQRHNIPLHEIASRTTGVELYNQIINPSIRFGRIDINPLTDPISSINFAFIVVVLVGIISLVVFYKSNYKTKYFLLFCLLMTLISLRSPADVNSVAAMATSLSGNRYFIYGIIGMFVIWAKFSQTILRKDILAVFLLVFFTFASVSSIRHGSFFIHKGLTDLTKDYSAGITEFNHNRNKGIKIPENPVGWYIVFNPKK